jgi:hypothetical protein
MFDALVDEIRAHTTEWLRREREELIAQQRQLRTREMALLRVLDERGQVDRSVGAAGESARVVRDKVRRRGRSSRSPRSRRSRSTAG